MGAVTAVIKRRYYPDGGKMVVADLTGSGSYATNGDTYTNSIFEILGTVDAIVDCGTPGYVLVPDIANKKIKYFKGAAGLLVEETNAVNLSAVTGRVLVIGDNPAI